MTNQTEETRKRKRREWAREYFKRPEMKKSKIWAAIGSICIVLSTYFFIRSPSGYYIPILNGVDMFLCSCSCFVISIVYMFQEKESDKNKTT